MSNNETNIHIRHDVGEDEAGRTAKRGEIGKTFVNGRIAGDIYCIIELTVIFLTGFGIAQYYVYGALNDLDFVNTYIYPLLILPLVFGLLTFRWNLYNANAISGFTSSSGKVIASLVLSFVALAVLATILGITDDFSRMWYGLWLTGASLNVWLLRAFAARIFRQWARAGALHQRIAIYGFGDALEDLLAHIGIDNEKHQISGIFGPADDRSVAALAGYRGDIDQLIALAQNHETECIVLAVPLEEKQGISRIIQRLGALSAEVKIFPHNLLNNVSLVGVSRMDNQSFIDIQSKTISERGMVAKLIEDYVIAAIGLVLLSPLLALIAMAIRLESRGPVFFTQERNGLNDKVFRCFKFRTMDVSSSDRAFSQAVRNDPRVTRVGRFLRATSLDELPQILNVLRGEMSIVGPRPQPVELNDWHKDKLPRFAARHRVKPGITGWAQVNDYRGPTVTLDDMAKRLEYDLYYIENWSVWLDLSIIAATPLISIIHKNAV